MCAWTNVTVLLVRYKTLIWSHAYSASGALDALQSMWDVTSDKLSRTAFTWRSVHKIALRLLIGGHHPSIKHKRSSSTARRNAHRVRDWTCRVRNHALFIQPVSNFLPQSWNEGEKFTVFSHELEMCPREGQEMYRRRSRHGVTSV